MDVAINEELAKEFKRDVCVAKYHKARVLLWAKTGCGLPKCPIFDGLCVLCDSVLTMLRESAELTEGV